MRCGSWDPLRAMFVLAFASGVVAPVQALEHDLPGVVHETLSSNPDVAEARNQWLSRREEVRAAEGGYLPTIDLNAGIGYEQTDNPTIRASGEDSADLTRQELGLNLRQMLFDGWGTRSEVARQQARTDSAAARLLSVAESTAMRATLAYVDLQRFQALQGIATESVATHKRIQGRIRLRSESGVGRRADLDQANSRVALAEVNLVAAEVNLRDAETTFRRVVGSPPALSNEPAEIAPNALPESLEQALQIAQKNNPVLQTAAADIEAARAQHEAAKQFDYPRFDFELGGNHDDNLYGTEGRVDDLSAMVRMRFNLFRGGTDSARKRATAYNISEAMDVRDRTIRQLEESIRLAWAAYQATSAQLPLMKLRVEAAKATRAAYEKQFEIGQRTLLDVLNSENEVIQGRESIVNATADRLLAQYRVLEAMGALVDHLGVAEAVVRQP